RLGFSRGVLLVPARGSLRLRWSSTAPPMSPPRPAQQKTPADRQPTALRVHLRRRHRGVVATGLPRIAVAVVRIRDGLEPQRPVSPGRDAPAAVGLRGL